jgi:AraC-like DNA-binding protein
MGSEENITEHWIEERALGLWWRWGREGIVFPRWKEALWVVVNLEGGVATVVGEPDLTIVPGWSAFGAAKGSRGLESQTAGAGLVVVAALDWLRQWLGAGPWVPVTSGSAAVSENVRRVCGEVSSAPVGGAWAAGWYQAKALEIVIHVLQPPSKEMFCERQKRVTRERVEKVKTLLAANLEHPLPLKVLAKEAGCSPHYLSRMFTQETGTTMSRYLRDLRLERAAELLREGHCNVTEAAMEVGYSSLSHFSKAFAGRFGVCPCVFPLKLPHPPKQKPQVSHRPGL